MGYVEPEEWADNYYPEHDKPKPNPTCGYRWKASWYSRLVSALMREPHGTQHVCIRTSTHAHHFGHERHMCHCTVTKYAGRAA